MNRIVGIFVVVLLTIVIGLLIYNDRPNNNVTWENYSKICKGMSITEVRNLLGKASYDEVALRQFNDNYYQQTSYKYFVGAVGTIRVHVFQGYVLGKLWIPNDGIPPPPEEK